MKPKPLVEVLKGSDHPQIKDLSAPDERKAPNPHPRPFEAARAQIKQLQASQGPRIVNFLWCDTSPKAYEQEGAK